MAKNGTVAYVVDRPNCNFHQMNGVEIEAKYDFKTTLGPWAYGCEPCWKDNRAYPELGIGKGQKLVTMEEKKAEEEADLAHELAYERNFDYRNED